ncbi:AAA family ATPase [uncultured Sphingomonas sp.]|uniref:AAA family ATPase n=1 Tax=uncultured Sphingomonas sp. TaxID=158754 RepID=UPI0025E9CC1A|nr:AAA family ATPase [uncultured Sphingomonas sp.]
MIQPPTAFLLHGFLGAGKTTLAKRLERDRTAIRFTHDEWMSRLYGSDPMAADFAAHARRVSQVMEAMWTRCLMLGVNIVLDCGPWTRAERDRTRRLVATLGGQATMYRLNRPAEIAWTRIARRNQQLNGALTITPETFASLQARFEPLDPDEERIEVHP